MEGLTNVPESAESDELASVRDDWQRYAAQLREIQAERDRLLAELRDALREVEHWRTLAEYRQATLLARQHDDPERSHEPHWKDYLTAGPD
ncbi:MAG: hypothetical protein ABSD85_07595 [Acidimicrobiales bacterium]|jgi:hypothetical protein